MRVLHFILGKADLARANGVNQVIAGLCKYSSRRGAEVHVVGKANTVNHEGEIIRREGYLVEAYTGWETGLATALRKWIEWAQVIHLHGSFSHWNLRVANMCDEMRRPYLVTLHNGLSQTAIQRGRFKKKMFHFLFQRKYLERASAIHVLTEEESTDVLQLFAPRKLVCIPNGIDLEYFGASELEAPRSTVRSSDKWKIGYIGRLSSEKNLDALCHAFTKINKFSEFSLTLAGPQSAYGDYLHEKYAGYGIEIGGARFGAEKKKFLESIDLFVQPSLTDAFSIAAMEALQYRVPLLITRTSSVSYYFNRSAFFMCEPTSYGLERGLRLAFEERARWNDMKEAGSHLINEVLNWSASSKLMIEAYSELVK